MTSTHITDNIGKSENAYALVALLSESAKQQVSQLLNKLSKVLGDAVWIMPREALHVTLCEIIQAKDYTEDKQALYDRHSFEYENVTADILSNYKPIIIAFDTVVASPQAIIIKGIDDGSFEKIRKAIVDKLPLPSETKLPPSIIHTSIARFTKVIQLDEVENIVNHQAISFKETIDAFQLVNNLTPPLLKYKIVRTYPLS